jgi:hypothetical protein
MNDKHNIHELHSVYSLQFSRVQNNDTSLEVQNFVWRYEHTITNILLLSIDASVIWESAQILVPSIPLTLQYPKSVARQVRN